MSLSFEGTIAVLEGFSILSGVLSAIGSLSVVVTLLLFFPTLMKGKVFVFLLCWAAVCDFFHSIANAWGFPRGSSALCETQGGFIFFWARTTMFWVLAMSFQLYALIIRGKGFKMKHLRYLHALCWPINLLLELIVLSTNRYGQDDEQNGKRTNKAVFLVAS